MFKSIRWKFITIYFLLVFIAMVIIGVFLLQQFQEYHLSEVSSNLRGIANNVRLTLEDIDWVNNREDIQENILRYEETAAVGMEIYVVERDSNFTIIAGTNLTYLNHNAMEILEPDLIMSAFNGEYREMDVSRGEGVSTKNLVYPVHDDHSRVIGAIYLRKNLDVIYKTLRESTWILIRATVLALFITVILGYLIAKSITTPINDVTIKAEKMAKGDFDQVVEIKSSDEIGQLASMFNYLTARLKSVLQEMSNEKQKMDTIITYMADGLVAVTEEGKILHANPRALEMLNIKEEELNRISYDSIFTTYNERLSIDRLKQGEGNLSGSEMMVLNNNVILRANYAPFNNEKGAFGGIILLLQDVTKHEKLEKMRKEFVANVSHELKTPLTTIKSYTETLLDGAVENLQLTTQFLQVIDNEADRMSRLVRDLLQLSNIDYQKNKWHKRTIDLNKILKKAVVKLEVAAKNKNQILDFELKSSSIPLYADEDRIEQVLLNIISNSIKYTPNGGQINITLENSGTHGVVVITDTGIGIPKEDLPRLFERFYRVDKARSREMGGTGLGLAIAKEIIDAHQGSIEITSMEEQGTCVTIKLPLIEENMCN